MSAGTDARYPRDNRPRVTLADDLPSPAARLQAAIRVRDRLTEGGDRLRVFVADREPVGVLERELNLLEGERVEVHVVELEARVVADLLLAHADAVHQQALEVGERELSRQIRAPWSARRAASRPAWRKRSARSKSRQPPGPKRGVMVTSAAAASRTEVSSWARSMTSRSVSSIRWRLRAGSASRASSSWPGHAGRVSRAIRFTLTTRSAPASLTAWVGTGTSASPSTSR